MIEITTKIHRDNKSGSMQCAFCMNTKDMYIIPINIDNKYCGNIFVCGGCYRHIMGRPENKLNSDSGEGNLLK